MSDAFYMLSGFGVFLFLCCAGLALLIWVIGREGK